MASFISHLAEDRSSRQLEVLVPHFQGQLLTGWCRYEIHPPYFGIYLVGLDGPSESVHDSGYLFPRQRLGIPGADRLIWNINPSLARTLMAFRPSSQISDSSQQRNRNREVFFPLLFYLNNGRRTNAELLPTQHFHLLLLSSRLIGNLGSWRILVELNCL